MRICLAAVLGFVAVGCSANSSDPADSVNDVNVQSAVSALSARGSEFGLGANDQYASRSVIVDADGTRHVRFDRTFRGMRVVGGDFVVHQDSAGSIREISRTIGALSVGAQARLSTTDAIASASAALGGTYSGSATAEQVVFAGKGAPALAYEVILDGVKADGTPSEMHAFVDASSGALLDSWDGIETASAAGTGKSFFSGTVALTTDLVNGVYNLRDPSRGNQYTITMGNKQGGSGVMMTDADNVWGNGALTDAATIGVDAQYGTAVTWDYYKAIHGRTGIANDGKGAYNRVHYGRNYNNAYWSDSCFCMTYGDGDGTTYNPFDSLDVAGHEMTHGVTSRSANLTYSGESGGLNEATSDIFGTMVEYYAGNANDAGDYKIGEKLYKSNPGETKALRYMYQPNLDGNRSPNCYSSTLGSLDVHYSSGVANHFFYLLAEGSAPANGPASPTCNGSSVTGIGRDAAAKIWYRALTVYMTSSTNYAGARQASVNAANDLYGAGSAQANAVAAAWSAVSVN